MINLFICKRSIIKTQSKRSISIKKREDVETKHSKDSKAFIEYSNVMDDVYKNTEQYNQKNPLKN